MVLFKCIVALLITLGHAMGPRDEDPLVSCKRLQLSSCSDEAQKPQSPSYQDKASASDGPLKMLP